MRDPDAALAFDDSSVTRHLHKPLPQGHFLRSELAAHWVRNGWLTEYDVVGERTVVAPRLDFISYPTEWCDAQLDDAARLTLKLARDLLASGQEFKDASAWNVLFDGGSPVFCDLLSVRPVATRQWHAFGQYVRHFVLPLLLRRHGLLLPHQCFLLWRDGVPPAAAAAMLGWRRFHPRFALLLGLNRPGHGSAYAATVADARAATGFRTNLLQGLEWVLNGARPRVSRRSGWARYEDDRSHYSVESLSSKREAVRNWLLRLAPKRVVDLGCNAGEFSLIGCETGARVVAIDGDHDALQELHRRTVGNRMLTTVLAEIDDLRGDRGWECAEQRSLLSRLEGFADVLLMLALVHHLAVASAIPLLKVAQLARRLTRRWLIVEWIHESDPQLRLLCVQHQREASEFGVDAQRRAFAEAGFAIREEALSAPSHRTLALLEAPAA